VRGLEVEVTVQFNTAQRELLLKIVYYGPALSGKTTNLQALHELLDPGTRGRLATLDTKGDRTLFFDLLPVHFTTRMGVKVNIKLFTVPGQVIHEQTRRLVLKGTDAVVFVADSQLSATRDNNDSYRNMQQNLRSNGVDPDRVPTVIQFNKRDLPNIRTDAELAEFERQGKEPVFKAVALRGEGVIETLQGILQALWRMLEAEHGFSRRFQVSQREFLSGVLHGLRLPRGNELPSEVER
jgi:signal recognition particle receptor subunit beta